MWLFDSLQIVLGKKEDKKKETSFVLLSTL